MRCCRNVVLCTSTKYLLGRLRVTSAKESALTISRYIPVSDVPYHLTQAPGEPAINMWTTQMTSVGSFLSAYDD